MIYNISGEHAVRLADRDGLTLRHGECGPYILVEQAGWIGGDSQGYNIDDYFRGSEYLGADDYGVEPTWIDAENPDRSRYDFLRGVADAMSLDAIEAEEQWGGYSRNLSDHGIREIESGGYTRGMEIGREITRFYAA